jgi:hypothetical protein
MIEALIAGETSPTKLASLASRRVEASSEELREALRGVTKHHRFLLQSDHQIDHEVRGYQGPVCFGLLGGKRF